MATTTPTPVVLTDAYIAVNGTALSAWSNHVTLTDDADQVEVTTFGPNSYRQYTQGLRTASIAANFFQDFGATAIDAILSPLYYSGGTFGLEIRPTSAGVSATNPKYTMTAKLYSYAPLNGDVGAASMIDTTFQNAGTAGLLRGTA